MIQTFTSSGDAQEYFSSRRILSKASCLHGNVEMTTTTMKKRRRMTTPRSFVNGKSINLLLFLLMVLMADRVHSFKEPPVLQSGNDIGPPHQRHNSNNNININSNNNNMNNKPNRRVLLKTGEPLKLVCPVEHHLDTIVDWTKNGQNIHLGWERYKMNEAVLRVKETISDDGGVYACKATNGFGSVVVKFHVYVYSNESRTTPDPLEVERFFRDIGGGAEDTEIKPFITDLQNYTVNAGETVTWFCDVYSNEEPKIQWFKKIDESTRGHQPFVGQRRNDTIYIGGSQYLPVSMDTGLTPASSATEREQQQQRAVLYSSKLELPSVDYDNQGMYLCAVFTPSYFDYKIAFVKISAGSSDIMGQPRRRLTNPEPETTSRADMTYVILIVILSMIIMVVIIVVLVVRKLRSNRVARTRSGATQANSKKGCIRVPQHPPQNQPMMMQPGPPIGHQHPYMGNQYPPGTYPSSSITSSPLPQNYQQPLAQHSMAYPIGGLGDEPYPNSTLPSNVHLQNVPYPGNAYQHLQQQQHQQQQQQLQQPKLTAQQLKLFQQQQQQQQMVALYDCGDC